MKPFLFIISIIISFSASSQIESVSLAAGGLTCSMCSRAIYKSLLKVPAVEKVTEDIQHSSYQIAFKDHAKTILDDLAKAVRDAGFSVVSMEISANFHNAMIPTDAPFVLSDISFVFVGAPKQPLDGKQNLILVDKEFLSGKERKKYSGMAGSAFRNGPDANARIYHVIISQS